MIRPSWWDLPERCPAGHEWGPGRILRGWDPCRECGGVGGGHQTTSCQAPGCRWVHYQPAHDGREWRER